MQMDLEREIERLEKISYRQTFYMATCDVWHETYSRVKAENDVIEQKLKAAWTALKEHESAEKARAAAAAAALKREARADIPASEPDFRERRQQFDERARAYRSEQKQTLAAAKAAAEEAEFVLAQEPEIEDDWVLVG